MPHVRRPLIDVPVLLLVAVLGGCGDDSSPETATENPLAGGAVTPSSLDDEGPGAGTLVVDGVSYEFTVEACSFGTVDGAERGVPVSLFRLAGDGVGPGEEAFTVTVERVFVEGDTASFSDSIVLHQPGLDFLVQAERTDTGGLIVDLRDPTATTPLLKLGDQHVSGSGTFGQRGGTVEDRTMPGTLAAGCPTD